MSNTDEPYRVGSLFAGIGGICLGFHHAGCEISWANEIDHFACQTYNINKDLISSNLDLTEGDIRKFDPSEHVDILTAGFPCQPYSIAGKMRGLDDERGLPMFKEIIRIAEKIRPRVIFMENVSVLKTINDGETFEYLQKLLSDAGYGFIDHYVMNSKDYSGIAQNRNRIYIAAFRDERDFDSFKTQIGDGLSEIPSEVNLSTIVDLSEKKSNRYYYSLDTPGTTVSKRYYDHFVPNITEKGIIYQYRRKYVRENKSGTCPALTACMGCGGHNVPLILDDYGIRKLTPKECLDFQGFPKDFVFPEEMADGHKYKQAGNSVTVPIIERFARVLVSSLRAADLN